MSDTDRAGTGMSDLEINNAISRITEHLKGPMSNLDRALLVIERKEMREELKARKESS